MEDWDRIVILDVSVSIHSRFVKFAVSLPLLKRDAVESRDLNKTIRVISPSYGRRLLTLAIITSTLPFSTQ